MFWVKYRPVLNLKSMLMKIMCIKVIKRIQNKNVPSIL